MKDQRKTEIRVGITVLASIFIFIWVFGWAKNLSVDSGRKKLDVEFQSVAGLEIGDPVTVNGVRKGYVDDIIIDGPFVITKLNIDSDIQLKTDANFSVMMLDLMGGKRIEVHPGVGTEPINYGIKQKGQFVGDIASAMAMLGNVQNDLIDVIHEIKFTLNSVNQTLSDKSFTADLKTAVANLSKLTENANQLILQNKSQISSLLKDGNSLVKNVDNFITENKDSIKRSLTELNLTLQESQTLLKKINRIVQQTESGDNNLGKLLNDPALIDDLKQTLQQAKELTKIIVEQLKANGLKVEADINLF